MGLFSSQEEAFAGREAAARLDPLSPLSNYSYIGALRRGIGSNKRTSKLNNMNHRSERCRGFAAAVSSLGGHWASYILDIWSLRVAAAKP